MTHHDAASDFRTLPDLAGRLFGGSVVAANDEFFAEKENLIKPETPAFQPYTFTHKGQLYDGWETRRRRDSGSAGEGDWAIVRLGAPGLVRGVVVDTAHFTGNYPEYCSVEGCAVGGYPSPGELDGPGTEWVPLVSKRKLEGDTVHRFPVDAAERFTHVRLSIYPDGGVARFRVHGEVVPDPRDFQGISLDLAALENGGMVADCSNKFYSAPNNLIMPGPARVMGEGWESARRRGAGNDWVTVRLAGQGHVRQVELDTSHFKGNAPGWASLRGCDASVSEIDDPDAWFELLPRTPLQPDTRHRFRLGSWEAATAVPNSAPPSEHPSASLGSSGAVTPASGAFPAATYVRLDIYPDGGMARLRLYGDLTAAGWTALVLRWFNLLSAARARDALAEAGAGSEDIDRALASRPVRDMAVLPWKHCTGLADT